jgi:hypothetical protein
MSEDATPTMFTLVHSNIPLSVLPIDCQRAVVTAITPAGESSTCAPIHFCNTNVGPCGSILIDPLSLGPVGWWKADSYLPLALGDNTPVGGPGLEWIDQSGNGRSGVTGSTKPNYRAVNTIFPGSGKPSLDFSVGNLDISGLTIGSGDFTFVFLYASTTGAPLNVFLGGVIGFPHNAPSLAYAVHGQYTVEDEATGAFHSPTDACANGGNFSGHPNIAIFRRSGNRLSFFNNSMNLGSIDCTSLFFSYQFTRLGQYTSAIGNHNLSGNFGEVMLFNKGISDADIVTLVEGYLRPRWCLTDCVA